LVRLCEQFGTRLAKARGRQANEKDTGSSQKTNPVNPGAKTKNDATGTYIQKLDANWLNQQIGDQIRYDVWVWRSVNVRFLRAVIHKVTGGRLWLRLIYWLEERFPHSMGEKGQYPIIVIRK
jgi:hypothetical protein